MIYEYCDFQKKMEKNALCRAVWCGVCSKYDMCVKKSTRRRHNTRIYTVYKYTLLLFLLIINILTLMYISLLDIYSSYKSYPSYIIRIRMHAILYALEDNFPFLEKKK